MKAIVHITVLFLVFCCISHIIAADDVSSKQQRPLIIVAEDYPPYDFRKNGKPTGIEYEIIKMIMDKINIPFEFKFYPFARICLLLQKGKADAAPSLFYQKERESFLYYTDSQRKFESTGVVPPDSTWMSEYVFFVNREYSGSLKFTSLEQVAKSGYRVGIIRGYSYNTEFRAAKLHKYMYSTPEEALRALSEGIIDLFPIDRTVGLWLIKQKHYDKKLTYLPKPIFRKPYIFAFSKFSTYPNIKQIMEKFNEELIKLNKTDIPQKIAKKYIGALELQQYNRPIIFVCEDWPPYEYMQDGKVKGIDAEVVDIIMKRLHIPYRIEIYPWCRAWLLAKKGKADAVLSVSYKATREKIFYYTQGQREFPETGKIPDDYLWNSQYVFFIKKSNIGKIKFESYKQIVNDGYIVGKNKNYSYNQEFREVDFKTRTFMDAERGFIALAKGDIDLYPLDLLVGKYTLYNMGLSDSITYLPKVLFSKPYLAPFCKKSDYPHLEEIMQVFYHELRLMRDSGEYNKIYLKYISGEK